VAQPVCPGGRITGLLTAITLEFVLVFIYPLGAGKPSTGNVLPFPIMLSHVSSPLLPPFRRAHHDGRRAGIIRSLTGRQPVHQDGFFSD